ncbi:hypothetical protein EDD17DRAFT_1507763 [Pisolithus thermaeus]|nr:hypothetical protein EV401DRAFT_1883125 [Pisolithus croceorrhizus]KAI6162914.1 hypothetical protein EDD17DRAFT_1507763 [Pisolithus thermaeus]
MYILVKLSRHCVLTSGWGKSLLPCTELHLPNHRPDSSLGIVIPAFVLVHVWVTTIACGRTTTPHRASSPISHVPVVLACILAIAACGVATVLGSLTSRERDSSRAVSDISPGCVHSSLSRSKPSEVGLGDVSILHWKVIMHWVMTRSVSLAQVIAAEVCGDAQLTVAQKTSPTTLPSNCSIIYLHTFIILSQSHSAGLRGSLPIFPWTFVATHGFSFLLTVARTVAARVHLEYTFRYCIKHRQIVGLVKEFLTRSGVPEGTKGSYISVLSSPRRYSQFSFILPRLDHHRGLKCPVRSYKPLPRPLSPGFLGGGSNELLDLSLTSGCAIGNDACHVHYVVLGSTLSLHATGRKASSEVERKRISLGQ